MLKLVRCLPLILLVACVKTPPRTPLASELEKAPSERMATFEMNGYKLSGAEYWPYVGSLDIDYPKEVLWGFYPEKGVTAEGETDPNIDSASPQAIACAEKAFNELKAFLATDSPALREISAAAVQGYGPLFYLWTNDYTRAAKPFPPGERPSRLWYWKRKVPDPKRPPGYWKWEVSLTQDGQCQTPSQAQMGQYLAETLATVRGNVAK